MIKDVFYQCLCGCKNTESQMEIIRKQQSGETRRLRCSKHKDSAKGNIEHRLTTCNMCGKEIVFSCRGGTIPENCKECLRPTRLAKMRQYARNRQQKKSTPRNNKFKNGHLYDESRDDCARREACLLYLRDYSYQTVPCLGGGGYQQKILDITHYLNSYRDDSRQHGSEQISRQV